MPPPVRVDVAKEDVATRYTVVGVDMLITFSGGDIPVMILTATDS